MKAAGFTYNFLASMAAFKDQAQDWLQDKAIGWPDQPLANKIDTHHHMVPDIYAKGVSLGRPDYVHD